MDFFIKTWLQNRLIFSNFINKFDRYNKPQMYNINLLNYDFAITYLQTLIEFNYKYKYDLGDRLRTPNSVWNRVHDTLLRDDCDGAAILAMEILHKVGISNAKLISMVPTNKFYIGHTLCLFQDHELKYHIIDYGTVSPGFNNIDEVLNYVNVTRYGDYKTFIISIDNFINNQWVNESVFDYSSII